MAPRRFTPQEANDVLPQVETGLAAAKKTLDELRHVRDQLADLRIIWGDQVDDAACPDHTEYRTYRERFTGLEADMARRLREVSDLGAEVKDPDQGLVDFYADRRGEVVYLCWRRGEPRVEFWHSLTAGFAGRKHLESF